MDDLWDGYYKRRIAGHFFFAWLDSPSGPMPPPCERFEITLSRTPRDKWLPYAETSTWHHTTLAVDPRLRQHGHWDQHLVTRSNTKFQSKKYL